MTDSTTEARQRVADLVRAAKVAMLTTTTADGKQVSRPMGLQEAAFDGDLWFFANEDSAKVAQIRATPGVNVSFSDTKGHSWASVVGRARVVHDRAKAEELYTPVLKAWFPEGVDTPGLILIEVEADTAEYWDAPTSTAAFVTGILRAAVTGDPQKDPITNDTVRL